MSFDVDAIRERIAQALNETTKERKPDPEPETYDQIKKRLFEGGDLSDLADRMFRY